nr:MAG TPA: hypothetical protein [Caudoviricetes sp.]
MNRDGLRLTSAPHWRRHSVYSGGRTRRPRP